MLITCPSCASAYDIDPGRIGQDRRKVRCAACRESWFVSSPESERAESSPLAPAEIGLHPLRRQDDITFEPSPPAEPPAAIPPGRAVVIEPDRAIAKRKPRGKKAVASSRGSRRSAGPKPEGRRRRTILAAALCAALPTAFLCRAEVVTLLPGTATLFRAVGLPVNLVGLTFGGLRSTLSRDPGGPVLEVAGEITNVSGRARAIPTLAIAIEGEAGEALYAWSARAEASELAAGATTPFRAKLSAPPPAGRRVEVTFQDGRDRGPVALR